MDDVIKAPQGWTYVGTVDDHRFVVRSFPYTRYYVVDWALQLVYLKPFGRKADAMASDVWRVAYQNDANRYHLTVRTGQRLRAKYGNYRMLADGAEPGGAQEG